jgi:hypothetical protein
MWVAKLNSSDMLNQTLDLRHLLRRHIRQIHLCCFLLKELIKLVDVVFEDLRRFLEELLVCHVKNFWEPTPFVDQLKLGQ